MDEIKHSPLPWKMVEHNWSDRSIYSASELLPVCGNYISHDEMTDEEQWQYESKAIVNLQFIVEACNNYYRLKEQNEMLLKAAKEVERFADQYMKNGSNSVYLMKAIIDISEAIKSCQPWTEK